MKVLVTGGAGFIGSHLTERLLADEHDVCVLDVFNDYYPAAAKRENVAGLLAHPKYRLVEGDIRDQEFVESLFQDVRPDVVIHLAAMPGVRASLADPALYFDINLNGTIVLLEAARKIEGTRFVFGSSSSVYGMSERLPFREDDPDLHQVSPYASSKRAGELVCYTYHHLYGIPMTALRFFTVYGPRQRPEMAIAKFTTKIYAGEELPLFGDGSARRDFTHVSDIVDGTVRAMDRDEGFRIYNLGESETVTMLELIETIGKALGIEPKIRFLDNEKGDVPATWADVSRARDELGYSPSTSLADGIRDYVEWFRRERAEMRG